MDFLVWILTIVYFITCFILIIVVLMQEPKGGGLSSAFGGAGLDTAFGASIGRKMSSFTVWIAVFFIVLTVVLAIMTKSESDTLSGTGSVMEGLQKPPAAAEEEGEKAPAKDGEGEENQKDEPEKAGEQSETPAESKAAPESPENKSGDGQSGQ